jgi:hypothetical protein
MNQINVKNPHILQRNTSTGLPNCSLLSDARLNVQVKNSAGLEYLAGVITLPVMQV